MRMLCIRFGALALLMPAYVGGRRSSGESGCSPARGLLPMLPRRLPRCAEGGGSSPLSLPTCRPERGIRDKGTGQ